jgi:hydrogenase expression/formation protein HypE
MIKTFTLQCPMPELDFNVITLGHGSGGRLTNDLLEAGVFSLFQNKELQKRHDGATLDINGKIAFSTDNYVISPVFFPESNIGELAVNGTVNDLAMCGARTRYISLGLILEEGLKMEELWEILAAIKISAQNSGVSIVTGDTKVVEKGKGDSIFINTTGIGEVHPRSDINIDRIEPGDAIILSGPMATHGIAIMTIREGLKFESEIRSDTRPLQEMTLKLIESLGDGVKLLRDPTRGGVATVLNEISRQRKLGVELDESSFPVNKQVAAACEVLGLDPLYVANEGIFIAVVKGSVSRQAINILRTFEHGTEAVEIGKIIDDHAGKVYVNSSIGGKRIAGMLAGEQLPRIC